MREMPVSGCQYPPPRVGWVVFLQLDAAIPRHLQKKGIEIRLHQMMIGLGSGKLLNPGFHQKRSPRHISFWNQILFRRVPEQRGSDGIERRGRKQPVRLKEDPRPAAQRILVGISGVRNVARDAGYVPRRKMNRFAVAEFQRAASLMAIAELHAVVEMQRAARHGRDDPLRA